jgi:hypothetical protein
MSTPTESTTRTLAGFASVLALLAVVMCLVLFSRTGLIAEFAGTTKEVSQANEVELLQRIDALTSRMDAVEAKVKAAAAAPAPAPAAEDAEGAE